MLRRKVLIDGFYNEIYFDIKLQCSYILSAKAPIYASWNIFHLTTTSHKSLAAFPRQRCRNENLLCERKDSCSNIAITIVNPRNKICPIGDQIRGSFCKISTSSDIVAENNMVCLVLEHNLMTSFICSAKYSSNIL